MAGNNGSLHQKTKRGSQDICLVSTGCLRYGCPSARRTHFQHLYSRWVYEDKSGGNGMTRTWGTQWSGGKDISFKPKYDALPPGRMHLDQMSDMLLYSRPYRSWTPWTDVWFCHCILAALLTIVLPLSSPTCLVLAGGNDIPPGFPQEEQYFELENGEQRP